MVRYLLAKGADVNAQAGYSGGITALQGASISGHIEIVLLLIEAKADINAVGAIKDGRMAIDGAAEHARLDTVQLLLNAGARSEIAGSTGYDRAIELADIQGHWAVANLLRRHGEKEAMWGLQV